MCFDDAPGDEASLVPWLLDPRKITATKALLAERKGGGDLMISYTSEERYMGIVPMMLSAWRIRDEYQSHLWRQLGNRISVDGNSAERVRKLVAFLDSGRTLTPERAVKTGWAWARPCSINR